MNNLLKIFLTAIILFGLQGCYTILWSPDKEFPGSYNSYESYNNYYYDDYYYDYYYYPWWFRITPPGVISNVERDKETETLRNRDGGRNSGDGRILTPGTPSKSPNNPGNVTIPPKGSDNGSDSSGRRNSEDNNSNSDVRNNDSGRNTDKGRR